MQAASARRRQSSDADLREERGGGGGGHETYRKYLSSLELAELDELQQEELARRRRHERRQVCVCVCARCLFIEATVKLLSAHETPCMLRAPFCRDDAPPHLMFLLFPPS